MNRIHIYPTLQEVSMAAAELFVQKVSQAVKQRGQCHVVLAGGETPRHTYEIVGASPYCARLPWKDIHMYWGDERCVPAAHHLSNQKMARQSLLNHVPIPPENIHPITYEDSPQQAAEKYELLLRQLLGQTHPQFDLILLGLGNDGHTASLFPYTDVLQEKESWVSPVYLQEQDMYRITLTPPILNQGRDILFLISGANKQQVVREVVEGPKDTTRLPAQLIQPPNGNVYWLLDQEAAALLTSTDR